MTTQTAYRQRFGQDVGLFASGTATSGSTGTSSLICASSPFLSSIAATGKYRYWWILRPGASASGDRRRRVSAYAPSTGTFTVDAAYTNAAYALGTGESFELHGLVEPLTEWNDMVNQALKRIYLVKEFTTTSAAVTDTRLNLTTAQSWLTNPAWVHAVGTLSASETRVQYDPYRTHPLRGNTYKDGENVWLYVPSGVQTTDTIYVRCLKPAYYHCKASGGSYGDRSGLREGTETDEAEPIAEWVSAGVMVECWRRYETALAGRYGPKAEEHKRQAARRFRWFQQHHLQSHVRQDPDERLTPPLELFGPAHRGRG